MTIYSVEITGRFAQVVADALRSQIPVALRTYQENASFSLDGRDFVFHVTAEEGDQERAADTGMQIVTSCLLDCGLTMKDFVDAYQVKVVPAQQ